MASLYRKYNPLLRATDPTSQAANALLPTLPSVSHSQPVSPMPDRMAHIPQESAYAPKYALRKHPKHPKRRKH